MVHTAPGSTPHACNLQSSDALRLARPCIECTTAAASLAMPHYHTLCIQPVGSGSALQAQHLIVLMVYWLARRSAEASVRVQVIVLEERRTILSTS